MTVKKVFDGDTVLLTDGRTVRLIGINTPEVAHNAGKGRKGNAAEPLAGQAQQALQRLVVGKPIRLQLGVLAVDHYGRSLGRLFTAAGESVEAQLRRLNPQGRAGSTAEVAHVVAAVCDPRAHFMNGAIVTVDGGQVAASPDPA